MKLNKCEICGQSEVEICSVETGKVFEVRKIKHLPSCPNKNKTVEIELKNQCTPEFIKWMCELVNSMGYIIDYKVIQQYEYYEILYFPLLIHRAVEGLNNLDIKKGSTIHHSIQTLPHFISRFNLKGWVKDYRFDKYQPQSLTQSECAMLHCLLDIFKGEKK